MKLNIFLDVQNITNRKNPEEIIYNYNFTPARLHHRPSHAGGAGRADGVLIMKRRRSGTALVCRLAGAASPISAAPPRWSRAARILAVKTEPPEVSPAAR